MQILFSAVVIFSMYELHVDTNVLPSALNKSLRFNRFKRGRENEAWDSMLNLLCTGKKPPAPLERAQITLVRHSWRTLDFDGLVGSMKPVVDALVECGILKNDTWAITGPWIVDQKFRSKKDGPLLEIQVRELNAEKDF